MELRSEGGGSCTTKTAAMALHINHDSRIRHGLVYAGAVATGRWSSVGVQLQNLPRNSVYDLPPILRDLQHDITADEIADLYGPPLRVISELLRPLIVAPDGHHLIVADYCQIEARILAWLAGEHHRLAMFRAYDDGGPDPYSVTAARLFSLPVAEVTPAQRQSGKIAELALGFQGGHRAIQKMGKNFGMRIAKATAEEWKVAWRRPTRRSRAFGTPLRPRRAPSSIVPRPHRTSRPDPVLAHAARDVGKAPVRTEAHLLAPVPEVRKKPRGANYGSSRIVSDKTI